MQTGLRDLAVLGRVGLCCCIAAIVGGGVELFGAKIPHLSSRESQVALGIVGLVLIAVDRIEQADPRGPTVRAIRESSLLLIASVAIGGVLLATALNVAAGAFKEGVLGSGDVLKGALSGATKGYMSLAGAVLGALAGLARRYVQAASPAIIVVAGGLIGASQPLLNPSGLAIIELPGFIGIVTLGLGGGVAILWVLGRLGL